LSASKLAGYHATDCIIKTKDRVQHVVRKVILVEYIVVLNSLITPDFST